MTDRGIRKGKKQMNKKLTKIAGLSLGIAMAIGVGVALSRGEREVEGVKATDIPAANLSSSSECTVNGTAGVKANKAADATITVPKAAGNCNVTFHAAAWNKEGVAHNVTYTNATSTTASITMTADTNVAGSSSDFTLAGSEATYAFTIALTQTDPSANMVINIAGVSNKRFVVWGASYESAVAKVLDHIELDTTGVKTVYETGETLDTTNLTVTAYYESGDPEVVTAKAEASADLSTAGDKDVTVSYTENGVTKSATYPITVNAAKTLKSVAISGQATATKDGDWNLDSLVVTGTATDDTSMGDITDKCLLSSSNSTGTIGEQHITVHVNYKEGTWEGDVEDVEAYVADIPLSSPLDIGANGKQADKTTDVVWSGNVQYAYLNRVSYTLSATSFTYTGNIGSSDSHTDWRIYRSESASITLSVDEEYEITKVIPTFAVKDNGALYDANNTLVESGKEYVYGLGNSLTLHVDGGNNTSQTNGKVFFKTITVEYRAAAGKTLRSIEIQEQPTTTVYNVGEDFDPAGMVVVAHYDGDRSGIITDYDWSPKTIAADTTKVVISYTEDGVTKTADVDITIKTIENVTGISAAPSTMWKGQSLNLEEIILTATYNDGSETTVHPTSYEVDALTVADEVDITYTFNGATGTKSVNSKIQVKDANRFVKASEIRPYEEFVFYSEGGIMNILGNGNYNLDYYNVNDKGLIVDDDHLIVDASNNVKLYTTFYLIPVTTGDKAGKYIVANHYSRGQTIYLDRDSNTRLGVINHIDERTCYFTLEFDEVTGEMYLSHENTPAQVLRRNGTHGFNCYDKTNINMKPVYAYYKDSFDPYVSIEPSSFAGVQNQYVDVYMNYQHQESVPTPVVESGKESLVNVELLSIYSTSTTKVYRVTLLEEGEGYIDFGSERFTFSAAADTVESIAIKTPPTKLTYDIGEEFDKTGLEVEATYASGKTEVIGNALIDVSGFDSSAKATNQKVTLTYATKTAFVYVNIVPTVCNIAYDDSEVRKTYYVGDTVDDFDRDGLKVYNVYTDGSRVETTSWELLYFDTSAPTDHIMIVFADPNYPDYSSGFYIEVLAVADDHLRVVPPTKTEYVVGQELAEAGMEVYLVKNNGDETQLKATQYEIEGFDTSTAGSFEATVKYKDNNEIVGKFAYTVVDKVITQANISQGPKQDYFVGETVPTDQWHIHVWYNDGTDRALEASEYQVEYPDMSTPGEKTINISIPNPNGEPNPIVKQFLITVHAIQLESIHITQFPTKTEYWAGEELDLTGLKVKKRMNNTDESWLNVEDLVLTGYDMNTPGNQTVTVSYTEDGITKSDTFNILVKEVTLDSIAVTTKPEKLTYYVGEELDLTGIVVTGTYSDGHTAEITNFTNDPVNMDEVGTATVTIRVGDKMTTFDIEIVNRPAPAKRGCGGSIAATSALLSLVAVGGIALISLKKRKKNNINRY